MPPLPRAGSGCLGERIVAELRLRLERQGSATVRGPLHLRWTGLGGQGAGPGSAQGRGEQQLGCGGCTGAGAGSAAWQEVRCRMYVREKSLSCFRYGCDGYELALCVGGAVLRTGPDGRARRGPRLHSSHLLFRVNEAS